MAMAAIWRRIRNDYGAARGLVRGTLAVRRLKHQRGGLEGQIAEAFLALGTAAEPLAAGSMPAMATVRECRQRIAAAEAVVNEREAAAAAVKDKLEATKASHGQIVQGLNQEAAGLAEGMRQAQMQFKAAETQVADLRRQVEKQQAQLTKATGSEAGTIQTEISRLQEALRAAEPGVSPAWEKYSAAKALADNKAHEAQRARSAMEEAVGAVQKELDAAQQGLAEARAALEAARKALTEAQTQLGKEIFASAFPPPELAGQVTLLQGLQAGLAGVDRELETQRAGTRAARGGAIRFVLYVLGALAVLAAATWGTLLLADAVRGWTSGKKETSAAESRPAEVAAKVERKETRKAESSPVVPALTVLGPRPGEVLAKQTVGAAGGKVEAAGAVSVTFPAGALEREQEVTIRRGEGPAGMGTFFYVEFPDSHKKLATAAQVAMKVPAGADVTKLSVVQEVGGGIWVTVPGEYDPGTGMMKAKAEHFSGYGMTAVKWAAGMGAIVGVVVIGAYALPGVGLVAAINGLTVAGGAATLGGMAATAYVTTDAALEVYRQYVSMGLDSSIEIPGFRILWANSGPQAVKKAHKENGVIFYDKRSGRILGMHALPSGMFKIPDPENTGVIDAPVEIVLLAWELQTIRYYFHQAGYPTPDKTLVLVHRKLGSNAQGEMNHAEHEDRIWKSDEVGMIHVNADELGEAKKKDRLASLTHEYFHGIATKNDYCSSKHAWLEDALCTAMESEVFPEADTFDAERTSRQLASFFGSGLSECGTEEGGTPEDATRRGYYFYPFIKWILHTKGHEEIRSFIKTIDSRDEGERKQMEAQFRGFAASLMHTEAALKDREPQTPDILKQFTGAETTVYTGWGKLSLDAMVLHGMPGVQLGRNDLARMYGPSSAHKVTGARGLSINVLRSFPAPPPGPANLAVLVVRRERVIPEEWVYALKPQEKAIGAARKVEDLLYDRGGVAVEGGWVAAGGRSLPLVLVNATDTARTSLSGNTGEPDALLMYYLQSPQIKTITPIPTNPEWLELEYEAPEGLGEGANKLKASDVIKGYMLSGWKDGKQEALAGLPPGPGGDGKMTQAISVPEVGIKTVRVKDAAKGLFTVDVPRRVMEKYPELSMHALDKSFKVRGKLVSSPVVRVPNPLLASSLRMPVAGFQMHVEYDYNLVGPKSAGLQPDGKTEYEINTEKAIWQGLTLRQVKSTGREGGEEIVTIVLDPKDKTILRSVTVESRLDSPTKKVNHVWTFENVTPKGVVDLGPKGPAAYVYWLLAEEVEKAASKKLIHAHGTATEYDKDNKPYTINWSSDMKAVHWKRTYLMVTLVTMTTEETKALVTSKVMTEKELEDKFASEMEKIYKRMAADRDRLMPRP